MTKTKIIATLGPASMDDETIIALIKAGADVFRLNMSHGDIKWHRSLIRKLKRLPQRRGLPPVCILADLSGPKIRVDGIEGGEVLLTAGDRVTLTNREVEGGREVLHVNYKGLGKAVRKGARVLMDDGMIELRAVSARPGEVVCKVTKGGTLKEHKGVNFPGMPLALPSLTDKDRADLDMLLAEGVDYIALSFVREASDVTALKEIIKRAGSSVPVIAKVERPEAIKNIGGIVRAADGVMVARGDLGVEMPPEVVPGLQKKIINLCNTLGKPVITATQMLESMVRNPRPTRAEASDVAGAVCDGTDALMLSEETAAGSYPAASVAMMNRIAREAERRPSGTNYRRESITTGPEAVAHSACRSAEELGVRAIISFTRSGRTALLVSKYRPGTAIIAATPDWGAFRRMRLYHGVMPMKVRALPDTDGMLREVEKAALREGLVRVGDRVVVTMGVPTALAETNLMRICVVGAGGM